MSTETQTDRWLTREDLRSRYQIGTANMKLRRWDQQGRFPKRHKRNGG